MARLGLELPGEPSVPEMARIALEAETLGFDSIWLTETRFTRDAVTCAAAVGMATSRMRVATAVVNPYTRGAVLTAVTAATLDELCGGRFILGIGPGSPAILERQGIPFDRPLGRLRETVAVVRAMLRGEAPAGMAARLDFAPVRPEVPIYLGVTGPKALALAGEIADGVLLNGFVSAAYARRAVAIVRESAERAGRHPDEVEIAASIAVSVDDDAERARAVVRPMVATYLAEFPSIARESGVPEEELARIGHAYRAEGAESAGKLLRRETIDDLAIAGAPDDVRRGLDLRRSVGVQLPVASLVDPSMARHLRRLAGT